MDEYGIAKAYRDLEAAAEEIGKAQKVLYRQATEDEVRRADRKNQVGTRVNLPALSAGLGAGYGALFSRASGNVGKPVARAAKIGGGVGAGLGLAGGEGLRRLYRKESKKGHYVYQDTKRGGGMTKPLTLAGDPGEDGEGFYGKPLKRVKRLPGD